MAARRGLRAAIALPSMLAIVDAVTGDEIATIFAAFAGFALVALADFGGPPRARCTAYLMATVICAGLIAIGTLVSEEPVIAGVVTLVVAFGILQVAAFGGAWATGMFVAMLSYVLAATVPAPLEELPDRLAGWGVGGVVATVLAMTLLPVYERPALWTLAAEALRAVARYVGSGGAPEGRRDAEQAVSALRTGYATAPYRPAGPAVRDRAFVALMEGLQHLVAIEPNRDAIARDPRAAELNEATAALLEATAAHIADPRAPAPELAAIDAARAEHRHAIGRRAASRLEQGDPADEVLRDLESAWWSRVVSFEAISLAADSVIVRGGMPLTGTDATVHTPTDVRASLGERLARVLHNNLATTSVRFRNCIRTAIGLAVAVTIAGLLSIDHAFWVGLATLSVLRSNALATGRTAIQAVGGTLFGFVAVYLLFGIFDAGTTVEWAVLPIAAFLAAYAPSAISFVVGQFAFTMTIVVMFDIIQPEGWHTGLVRVEDIMIGAGVSLLVGVLLWPRGAIGMLRRVLAGHLRADADYVDAAAREVVIGGDDPPCADQPDCEVCRRFATDAARRVADAFDDLLSSPTDVPDRPDAWAALEVSARRVHAVADLLAAQAEVGFVIEGFPDAARALRSEARELAATLRAEAAHLLSASPASPVPPERATRRRESEIEVLGQWGGAEGSTSAALGVVWMSELLHAGHQALAQAAAAVSAVARP